MKKPIKDWSKEIDGLGDMDGAALENLYSEMLATAHDIGFKVPDDLLVETQDPDALKKVIQPLHEAIKKYHSEMKVVKAPAADKAPKAIAKVKKDKAPKKPAKKAAQKEPEQQKEDTAMANVAKKTAAPKKAAKTAKKVAKKGAAKKAASGNARTPVARSSFAPDAKISVTFPKGEIPAREGSGVYDRLANLKKFDGKTVKAFLDSSLGRSSTLSYSVKEGWAKVK